MKVINVIVVSFVAKYKEIKAFEANKDVSL